MSGQESHFSMFSRSYRPWGQVRQRNMVARLLYIIAMTAGGLTLLAGMVIAALFAASVAVVGVVAFLLTAVAAAFSRKAVKVEIRSETRQDGVLEARKKGSTWTVY